MVAEIGAVFLLVICGVYDARSKKIPIWTLAMGAIFAMICMVMRFVGQLKTEDTSLGLVIGQIVASIVPGLIFLILSFLTEKKIGYGDGLLLIVLGIMEGFKTTVLTCCIGLFLQSIVAVILVIIKKADKQTEIPFVPFLFLARILQFF